MVALGFGAFPLRTLDKRPFTKNGFHDAVFTEKQVTTFLGHAGVTGYGIVAPMGSDLIVWDIDPGDGKGVSWRQAFDDLTAKIGSKLPPTFAVKTPSGGWHLYFRVPQELALVKSDLMLNFTVRRPWMGYVVGPGSEVEREDGSHADYRVIHDGPITALPTEWVNAALAWNPKAAAAGLIVISGGYQMPAVVHENHRYDEIRAYVAHLYNTGLGTEEIWTLVKDQLAPKFSPPLAEADLRDRFDRTTKDMAARLGPPAVTSRRIIQTIEQRQAVSLTRGVYSTQKLSGYALREMEWLWPDWLPIGVVTLLDGNPGVGKSTIVMDLISRMSLGQGWPDGQNGSGDARKTLYITREDDPAATLAPRMLAAGGDPQHVDFLDAEFVLPDDALRLDALVGELKPDLLVIDPIFSHVSAEVKTISDNDARVNVMNPLMSIAGKHQCAVLVLRHFNKQVGSSALNRGAGSLGGFVGAARQVLAVTTDPDDEEGRRRVFGVVKSSYAEEGGALLYQIEGLVLPGWRKSVSRIEWLGRSNLTIDDILSDSNPDRSRGAADELDGLLRGVTSASPADVISRMKARGYGRGATYTAAKRLGVVKSRSGFQGPVMWHLPTASLASAPAQGAPGSLGRQGSMASMVSGGQGPHTSHTYQTSHTSHGHESPGKNGETIEGTSLEPPEGCQDPIGHSSQGLWQPSLLVEGTQWCSSCTPDSIMDRELTLLGERMP